MNLGEGQNPYVRHSFLNVLPDADLWVGRRTIKDPGHL